MGDTGFFQIAVVAGTNDLFQVLLNLMGNLFGLALLLGFGLTDFADGQLNGNGLHSLRLGSLGLGVEVKGGGGGLGTQIHKLEIVQQVQMTGHILLDDLDKVPGGLLGALNAVLFGADLLLRLLNLGADDVFRLAGQLGTG